MTTAVVFDYGFGNVRSMVRALANLGVDTTLTSDYRQSLEADGLVVPGVGAFAACMEGLKKVDGDRVIYDRIRAGRPVLGVCVGEQIMFEHGLEHGAHAAGIGLIGGSVNLLDADVVPHMGWDTIEAAPDSVLLNGVENERFYFCLLYTSSDAGCYCFERRAQSRPQCHSVFGWPSRGTGQATRRDISGRCRTFPEHRW